MENINIIDVFWIIIILCVIIIDLIDLFKLVILKFNSIKVTGEVFDSEEIHERRYQIFYPFATYYRVRVAYLYNDKNYKLFPVNYSRQINYNKFDERFSSGAKIDILVNKKNPKTFIILSELKPSIIRAVLRLLIYIAVYAMSYLIFYLLIRYTF